MLYSIMKGKILSLFVGDDVTISYRNLVAPERGDVTK